MKKIMMLETRSDGHERVREFERVSRWITIKHNYEPHPHNRLWDYVTDSQGYHPCDDNFDTVGGLYLDYLRFDGCNYAIEQFWRLGNPFYMPVTYSYEERGEVYFLHGVDMGTENYSPSYRRIYIEFENEWCERVRVYREV